MTQKPKHSNPDRRSRHAAMAEFRFELRRFAHFSEVAARELGLTPQQHQALLSIHGTPERAQTIGELANRLMIKPHSATGLASRLIANGLIERQAVEDRRVVQLRLTRAGEKLLSALSRVHEAELRRIKPLLHGLIDRIG